MKSPIIASHFEKLKQQRNVFYAQEQIQLENPWRSLAPGKWSIAETIYHLVLMLRLFRRFSKVYVPLTLPFSRLFRAKPYKTNSHDIYERFRQNKKRSMNAPFLIVPPTNLIENWTFEEIKAALKTETVQLMRDLSGVEQDLAGHIRYPDPIADYPNLIQCVHLLAIHEQHHFDVTNRYL